MGLWSKGRGCGVGIKGVERLLLYNFIMPLMPVKDTARPLRPCIRENSRVFVERYHNYLNNKQESSLTIFYEISLGAYTLEIVQF